MAVQTAVARRYAQAYFDLAREARDIDRWGRELMLLAETIGSDEVLSALSNPRFPAADRIALVTNLTDGLSDPARSLARLLLERGRIALVGEVVAQYTRLADEAMGRVNAEVVTAVPVDDGTRRRITETLSRRLGGTVQPTFREDPAIIGGLVVRIGGRVIDSSVRTRLQQLRGALT